MNLQKPSSDLPWIDGLRAFAVLVILLFHLNPVLTDFFGAIPLLDLGWVGVDLFFALSGFLVFYHHANDLSSFRTPAYRKFLMLRLARIYPLHLAVLLALALLVTFAQSAGFTINRPEDYTSEGFVAHLLLISAWSFPAQMTWNYYAWAISALWMMYLLSPGFVIFTKRMENRSMLAVTLFLLVAFIFGLRLIQPYESFVSCAILRAIAGFGIGMLLCRLFQETSMPQTSFGTQKTLRFIARISYALYMVQFPVIMIAKKAFPTADYIASSLFVRLTYLTVEIAVVFILALAAHYVIEAPARRFLSKRIR